ncbi:hypothetical protein KAFR_0F00140 [Kazachstania africana CBS 2517]|uniref:Rho-GAP domain-containing protein n=1 Tax=Kazachstania africana (strain ATCC 22294 / BCRC 22015 / CBS 2517 / CECT 1963 / NBRC 1671 / NRRL Y-8276) TaxID=1071382 RepID=H2AW61_KAZAF|nr:hypothetical protein KAFR_0F00140 [Kazachstania africana CBS 2517]CCF58611.1 hypothetical protein KAFR_0F00140 [Kazachstania africana CBS 2517]
MTSLDLTRNEQSLELIDKSLNGPTSNSNLKKCETCGKSIASSKQNGGSVLKALGNYYHEDCFTCRDCSKPLKPKYFPYQASNDSETILLCQYHYFKRHDLLCKVCDKPLRGLFYTAFGARYDEEHFCCSICKAPCGVKKCFTYNDQLFCKYHFLKYFSKRCKGCKYPISDQYIEFPRSEEIHCWHPECYGIHKYWHVTLSSEALALPLFPRSEFHHASAEHNVRPTAAEMEKFMSTFNFIVSKTWSVLYRFEEESASCISDMFQYLSCCDQIKGIEATALFVLKVECLFKSLDNFEVFNESQANNNTSERQNKDDNDATRRKYAKLPRSLTTKIMIYLQLLRKLGTEVYNKESTLSSLMSIITRLAHFLKLLTRYGLFTSLEMNVKSHSLGVLLKFLKEIERNEIYTTNPFTYINVPIDATDACHSCKKYIQEECVQFNQFRWHIDCFACSNCHSAIERPDITESTFSRTSGKIFCPKCPLSDAESLPGFKYISKLSQLMFLLKIALVRSKVVMEAHLEKNENAKQNNAKLRRSLVTQETYIRTLNDIKKLRSRRESVRIGYDKRSVRRSLILDTPEEDLNDLQEMQRKGSLKILDTIDNDSTESENREMEHDNVFNNTKTLTLDDISRIVAAEQARELRPNAFTHFNKLKDAEDDEAPFSRRKSGTYYGELSDRDMQIIHILSYYVLLENKTLVQNELQLAELKISVPTTRQEKANFWEKMKIKMNKDSKKVVVRKVFGTPLSLLSEKWGTASELGVGPSKIRIPTIVDELISLLRQMDMSVEGIFRKNGNIRKLREISTLIDDNPNEFPDLSKVNAIQLSALLKKFIRDLPDPIMTNVLYDLWIKAAKIERYFEKQLVISMLYALLPKYNRNLLEVLLSFLHWTASFSYIENELGSKMDIHNLSTVIAPNILFVPENSTGGGKQPLMTKEYNDDFAQKEGQHHFLAIEIIDYLITYNEQLAMVPKFLMNLLNEVKSRKIDSDKNEIRTFVSKSLQDGTIDFSEFDVKNSIKVKHSSTAVIQNEMLHQQVSLI